MRLSTFACGLFPLLALVSAIAIPHHASASIQPSPSSDHETSSLPVPPQNSGLSPSVEVYDPSSPYHRIVVPCQACLPGGADVASDLIFDFLPLAPTSEPCTAANFALNGEIVALTESKDHDGILVDVPSTGHRVSLSAVALCIPKGDLWTQELTFTVMDIDEKPLAYNLGFSVVLDPSTDADRPLVSVSCNTAKAQFSVTQLSSDSPCTITEMCHRMHDAISKVVADLKTMLRVEHSRVMRTPHQSIMSASEGYEKCSEKPNATCFDTASEKLSITNDTIENGPRAHGALIVALEVLAAAIGLKALCALIFRYCLSLRRRVEHLADREERRTAWRYRCAARQEAMRRQWRSVKRVFCFGSDVGPEDEEKRALILEATVIATTDHNVPQEAMLENEITNLQYAHDVVASILRARSGAEPGPSSGAHRPLDTRSRASTLPLYDSEKLPDYASDMASDIDDGRERFRKYTPSTTDSVATTGITPESSIPDISSRCSGETLWTERGSERS